MALFRYALFDYRPAVGMLRGYFAAVRDFGEHAVAEPGDMLPVCVLVGAVPRLIVAQWSRPGTTIHGRQRAGRMATSATALAVARSRIYGPLYHRRQRCLVPASGYYATRMTPEGTHHAYLRARDGGLIAFAGLYEQRMAGEGALSYTIVACNGNNDMPCEPLVLAPEQYDAWLNHEDPRHLLAQRAAHRFEAQARHARIPQIGELILAPAADSGPAHNARA